MTVQVAWTSGEKSLLLWCAFSGLFLGSIHHGDADDFDQGVPGRLRREDGDKEEKRLIDPKKVGLLLSSHLRPCPCQPGHCCRRHRTPLHVCHLLQ